MKFYITRYITHVVTVSRRDVTPQLLISAHAERASVSRSVTVIIISASHSS